MNTTPQRIINNIGALSIPLILGIVIALIWANLDYLSYSNMVHYKIFANIDTHFLFNDVFMTFFFATATVEIVHSLRPKGNLYPLSKAVPTIFATAGGLLTPIAIFFILNTYVGSPEYVRGWAIGTATDVAVALLFAKFIFDKNHPAISFLLLLAILDDAVGMIIIATFYSEPSNPINPLWVSLVVLAIALAWILNHKLKIRSYWPYILICGILSWTGMFMANLHSSLALATIVPFFPTVDEKNNNQYALKQFEADFKLFVEYGLFFFGLVNAGVMVTSVSELTIIIFASLFIGKTLGIPLFTKLAKILGFKTPSEISAKELLTIGMIASVGLTVSLLITDSAYHNQAIKGAAKMGVLFSVACGLMAIAFAKIIGVEKFKQKQNKINGRKKKL